MRSVTAFIKKEPVLIVSLILAAVSCFFVSPDLEYFSYIDFKTLTLLFCLMTVMAGLSKAKVFSFCAAGIIKLSKGARGIVCSLTLLCLVFSAVITNDVALITFVPFAITALKLANRRDLIPLTVVLQTVAANMGSCLTPIGNPQNIYLYSISGMSFGDIFFTMLPYALATIGFLLICLIFIKNEAITASASDDIKIEPKQAVFYAVLFALCVISVFGIIGFIPCLILLVLSLLIFDRKILLRADYSLLLTFVGFFIFVGNMGRIPFLKEQIELWLKSNEVIFSAVISQVISNVPAALLLSEFTENYRLLLIGVNIGGLGTLIASMASLISYKYIARELPDKKGKYLLLFTAVNLLLLLLMLGINQFLK